MESGKTGLLALCLRRGGSSMSLYALNREPCRNDKIYTAYLMSLLHRGVSNAPYRSKQQNLLDCGFKRAAMTIASIIDMTRFFCHDALPLSIMTGQYIKKF